MSQLRHQLLEAGIEPMADNLQLVLALIWVVQHHYANRTSAPLTLAEYSTQRANHWQQRDLIEAVLLGSAMHDGKSFYVQSKSSDWRQSSSDWRQRSRVLRESPFTSYIRMDEAIWFLDSLQAFYTLKRHILSSNNNYQRTGYFCIVYTGAERGQLSAIRQIFEHLFALYITNVNLFVTTKRQPHVFTYFPFQRGQCHWSKPQFYLSFGDITVQLQGYRPAKQFFPSKAADMQGCELGVTTYEAPPYIMIERDARTGAFRRLSGIEGRLLTLLAERMNFSIRFMAAPNNDRGYIYENGTATGAAKMIIDGMANVTIGMYYYEQLRAEHMQPAYSYLAVPVLIAIPRGRPLTPHERLTKPFRYIIWLCLSGSLLCALLVIFGLRCWRRANVAALIFGGANRTPLTNLCNSLLGGSLAGVLPRRNLGRYLLAVWLLYTFVLRSAYQGELFIMLQDGRARNTLQNIQQAVADNYTFYPTRAIGRMLTMSLGDAVKVHYLDRNNLIGLLLPRLQAGGEKLAVPILLHAQRMYNQRARNYAQRINVLPEKFVTLPITFYMRRHSYLLHEVNDQLQRIITAGIIGKFESQYVDANAKRLQRWRGEESQPMVLSIWTLFGLFSVYLLLLFFCTLVFLLELWAPNSPLVASLLDMLNC